MIDAAKQALAETGFEVSDIIPDSKLRRFRRNSEQKNQDSWIVAHSFNSRSGEAAIIVIWGDWGENREPYTYCSLRKTGGDKAYVAGEIKKALKKVDDEEQKEREICRKESATYLAGLTSSLTPYLQKKGLSVNKGLSDGALTIVPVTNKGVIHGYQTIQPDGTKRFRLHTAKKGNYFIIPGTRGSTFLVEGFASGCTVNEATGCEVIVAFDAVNLKEVKRQFPHAILAGDNDEAGHCMDGIFPPIEGKGNNDWNDYHRQFCLDAVRELLMKEPAEYVRPLGYKDDTYYYTSSSNRQIVELASPSHTENNFYNLQPRDFWERNYPSKSGPDYHLAASNLMHQARPKGIFDPKNIRGTGVWADTDVIVNCGNEIFPYEPKSKYIYIVSKRIPKPENLDVDVTTLTSILENLSWKHPNYGKLLAGWLTIAPFAGILQWRPHMWLTGMAGGREEYGPRSDRFPRLGAA